MKKFLSVVVAFGMVAGVAATASALELKVKGKYVADGFYIDQGGARIFSTMPMKDDNSGNNDWYQHTFRIDPTLIVNDKIQVKSDIRLVDSNSVWGSQDDLQRFNGDGLRVNKLWLTYDSPVGKVEVGRRPAGAWMNAFVNNGTAADRIMWWLPKTDNVKAYAFLQKSTERDAYDGTEDNADNDYYEVAGAYVADNMNIWVGIGTRQDNGMGNVDMWRVKSYGDFAMGDAGKLYYEVDWLTGDKGPDAASIDIKGSAFIAGWMGNFGNVSPSVHYAYISGDNTADNEDTAYSPSKGMGSDFEPLYILTGQATNVLNGDRGPNAVGSAVRQAGAHAIVALADYKVSEDLTLHGGLGWGMADEAAAGQDDEYGWEVDLGMAYKLYQNLTYAIHLGYWAVGDFAKMGAMNLETEDVVLLSHHLSMKF